MTGPAPVIDLRLRQRAAAPVIVGSRGDVHVTAVLDELHGRGAQAVVIDADQLDAAGGVTACDSDGSSARPRGWIRRLATPGWRRDAMPDSEAGVERSAWLTWLTGWIEACDVGWITPLHTLIRADNKLVQYAAARDLAVMAPRTFVATRRGEVEHLGETVVVKPLGPDQLVIDGEARHVPAQAVATATLEDDAMAAAPFLYQEVLSARRHLRAVTVGPQAFLASLDAAGLPLDWRSHGPAHDAFEPCEDPGVASRAVALAASLNVGYSSQDWIVTDDGTYFLDLNPAGQWLFLPDAVSTRVTSALVDALWP